MPNARGGDAVKEDTVHPHRASSDQAEPLLPCLHPNPAHTLAEAPCQSKTGRPQACGRGHLSAPQKGPFPLDEGPLLAAPSSVPVLGSASHDYTPVPPPTQRPPPPAQVPPRLPLLYSTLGPGSAVTYTAERYSYGRMGQKETQVRCPPMPGGTGPLDQGGDACLQLLLPTSTAPPNGRPSAGPGICLSALFPARGLMPRASTSCLTLPPARAQHLQPLPPATKLLSKQGTGSPGGASSHISHALLGELPEGRGGTCLHGGQMAGSKGGLGPVGQGDGVILRKHPFLVQRVHGFPETSP